LYGFNSLAEYLTKKNTTLYSKIKEIPIIKDFIQTTDPAFFDLKLVELPSNNLVNDHQLKYVKNEVSNYSPSSKLKQLIKKNFTIVKDTTINPHSINRIILHTIEVFSLTKIEPFSSLLSDSLLEKNPTIVKTLMECFFPLGPLHPILIFINLKVHDIAHYAFCPNNHFYVIGTPGTGGQCAGPTEVLKCRICNSDIGGISHNLLPSNRRAQLSDFKDLTSLVIEEKIEKSSAFSIRNLPPVIYRIIELLRSCLILP